MTIPQETREQIAKDYLSNPEITQIELGNLYGVHKDSILKILREYSIPVRNYTGDRSMSKRIRNFDFDFFDRRDKITAYWAGFFVADGHIHIGDTGGASLICYVDSKDSWHIQQFYNDISYGEPLKFRKDGYVGFELHYAKFKHQLPPWGVAPNKTKKFTEPTCITRELLPHFLRGWIDGDGNVYIAGSAARLVIASGNRQSMDWFANSLRILGYDGHIGVRPANSYSDNWVLYIGGSRQVQQVAKILKADTEFCMDRKWKTSRLD